MERTMDQKKVGKSRGRKRLEEGERRKEEERKGGREKRARVMRRGQPPIKSAFMARTLSRNWRSTSTRYASYAYAGEETLMQAVSGSRHGRELQPREHMSRLANPGRESYCQKQVVPAHRMIARPSCLKQPYHVDTAIKQHACARRSLGAVWMDKFSLQLIPQGKAGSNKPNNHSQKQTLHRGRFTFERDPAKKLKVLTKS